jgi:hypothetical protein
MICADFLAGANLDEGDSGDDAVLNDKVFEFLPGEPRQGLALENCNREPRAD